MNAPTVTVHVRPSGSRYLATTHESSAIDPHSEHAAARKCAARHLGVNLDDLLVFQDEGERFVATVKRSHGTRGMLVLVGVVAGLVGALIGLVFGHA